MLRVVMSRAFSPGDVPSVTMIGTLARAQNRALLVAVTITVSVVETNGAVKRPLLEMLPALAVQVTPGLRVLVTLAVNCIFRLDSSVAVAGVIST